MARKIEEHLLQQNLRPSFNDLTGKSWKEIAHFDYSCLQSYNLLIVGFPVYAWKIVEPMEKVLKALPKVKNRYAAIFITYGGVTIGTSLVDAGKLLTSKGYILLGALKIVAQHSNVLEKGKDPLCCHPNQEDLKMVSTFTRLILKKGETVKPNSIVVERLKTRSHLINLLSKSPMAKKFSRKFPPGIQFDTSKCVRCGACEKACPVNIIKLHPYPERYGICIKCHNCKRVCPANAIRTTGKLRKSIFHFGLQKLLMKTGGERPWCEVLI